MAIRAYHDFVLFTYDVEEDQHGRILSFKVRVFDSPVGQGEVEDTVRIADYADLIQASRDLEDRQLDGNIAAQQKLGTRLGELLLPAGAREMLDRSYDWLRRDEGLRLRLRLEVRLADLPWEYVYLDKAAGPSTLSGFLALHPRLSLVRHEALALPAVPLIDAGMRAEPGPTTPETGAATMPAEWLPPPAPADRRRVVIAMATPQPYADYPLLELLSAEQLGIRSALERVDGVDVTYLPRYESPEDYRAVHGATLTGLQAALASRTDIFHFSGHGEFKKALGPGGATIQGEGSLVLATEQNQAYPVSAEEIRKLIGEREVRLVVLGACESARRDPLHKLSSVAVSLLKGRIPCVVAMQFSIVDGLAAAFVEAFYEALVAGLEIDEAVALGRAAVWSGMREDGRLRDWGVPVLYLRTPGGRIFQPVTNEQVRKEAEQRSRQRFDLNAAWWDWMARGDLASPGQLGRLAAADERLQLSPLQVLLLLRSAVKQDVSPAPWLERLRQMGAASVAQLREVDAGASGPPAEGRTILGLDDPLLEPRPPDVDPLAWSAGRQEDQHKRQVAALALTAIEESRGVALAELEKALRSLGPWAAFRRRAELRGTLADADPEVEKLNSKLPPWDRAGAWGWRVRRRVRRDERPLARLIAGGAIGAGLGLGLLRLVLAILPAIASPLASNPGVQFGMYAYWGGIVGLFLCLGLLLADPLLLRQMQLPGRPVPRSPDRQRFVLAVGMGTLSTGLALLLESWLNGLRIVESPLVPPLGLLFGLGLGLALYGLPAAGRRLDRGRALLRLAVAPAAAVLTQLIFILADKGSAIAIAWPGTWYHAYLGSLVERWWPGLAERVPRWADMLGLADAALVGAVLAAGAALGMSVALRSIRPAGRASEEEGGPP